MHLAARGIPAVTERLKQLKVRYAVTGSWTAAEVAPVAPPRLLTLYVDRPHNVEQALGLQELLLDLFDRILIPEAVRRELQAEGTPEPVRQFIAAAPDWMEVRSAPEIPATLAHLDSGEREALALALTVRANFVLIDERIGRQAAERKLVNPGDALGRLQKTNFRVSPRLLKSVRERKPID